MLAADLPPNRVAELMWKATGIRKTGDQCRTRWTKVDNPSITKGSWSQHEDDLLSTAVRERTKGDSPPPWVAVRFEGVTSYTISGLFPSDLF